MKTYKYLLAASLLGLAACTSDPATSVPASSTPVDPGTSSVSSSGSETDERAEEIIAAVKSLASNSYTVTVGENSGVVTDRYIADKNGGILTLPAIAGDYENIAYQFGYDGADFDIGLALKDENGEPIGDARYLEPDFENVDVSAIVGISYGQAIVTDEESALYKALAFESDNVSGRLTISLSSAGKITASYDSGLSVVFSNIGNSSDERVETYLASDPLSAQGVGFNSYANFVSGGVYNGTASFYEVADGVKAATPVKSVGIVETKNAIIILGTTAEGIDYPMEAVVRGMDELAYNMVPEYNEDGTLKSYELVKRLDESGAEVPFASIPRTDTYFDIGGFRKVDETLLSETEREDSYHYYGWNEQECYDSLVPTELPVAAELTDIDLTVSLPVGDPVESTVSKVVFETGEGINEDYEEVSILVEVEISDNPQITNLDDYVVAA